MKKDIHIPEVTDVGIAVVKEQDLITSEPIWNVYLINLKEHTLVNTFVSSRGYGLINNEQKKTAKVNYFLKDIDPQSYKLIEPIIEDVFALSNEYFLTFYINGVIHDKKFVFVAESIQEAHFTTIKVLGKRGVIIK
jgi:hypothetical protein